MARRERGGVRTQLRESRALKHLDLDAAFFWLIIVFLVTVLTFFSLRPRNVQLTGKQVAEYERRTQFFGNSTVYIVETGRPEGLLSVFTPDAWTRVSQGIDYVAFVYDDLPLFLTESWVEAAEGVLQTSRAAHGLGIALFSCGCVLPNTYFRRVSHRLNGAECALLPGWVLATKDVHWLDINDPSIKCCRRRSEILDSRGARANAKALQSIRATVATIEAEIVNATAVRVEPPPPTLVSTGIKAEMKQVPDRT